MTESSLSSLPDLKESLLRAGVVNSADLQRVLLEQAKDLTKPHFLDVLLQTGKCDEQKLVNLLSEEYGYRIVSLKMLIIDKEVLKLIPRKIAEAYGCLPISLFEKTLTIAIANPTNIKVLDELQALTGKRIRTSVTEYSQIKEYIEKSYQGEAGALEEPVPDEGVEDLVSLANMVESEATFDQQQQVADLMEQANQAPVVKLVNMVLVSVLDPPFHFLETAMESTSLCDNKVSSALRKSLPEDSTGMAWGGRRVELGQLSEGVRWSFVKSEFGTRSALCSQCRSKKSNSYQK